MVGEHLSPDTDHQMLVDVSSPQPSSPAEMPDTPPGAGARAEGQERRPRWAGEEEEQRRAGAGWEGSFRAEQEPPSASESDGGGGPQAAGGSRIPVEDRAQALEGLRPGGSEDSRHLATAARQHSTVPPHRLSPPL